MPDLDPAAERALVEEWRDLLARHAATACALDRELNDRHGLGMSEFEVLERLAESVRGGCEKLRVQELADAVHLSQSALSRLIGRLERNGLVERAMCSADRRGIFVSLTPAGRSRYQEARPTQRQVLARTLAREPGSGCAPAPQPAEAVG